MIYVLLDRVTRKTVLLSPCLKTAKYLTSASKYLYEDVCTKPECLSCYLAVGNAGYRLIDSENDPDYRSLRWPL